MNTSTITPVTGPFQKAVFPVVVEDTEILDIGLATTLFHLPTVRRALRYWTEKADAWEVVQLLIHVEKEMSISGTDAANLLTSLRQTIKMQIRSRPDFRKIAIWIDAGVEPPDAVLADPEQPACTGSKHRQQRKGKCGTRSHIDRQRLAGFRHYALRERKLRTEIRATREKYSASFDTRKPTDEIAFVESTGPAKLFCIREAESLFRQQDIEYGRDHRDLIRSTFRALVEKGNRRQLAPAPSPDEISHLRQRFPNATELIDLVDRAASLSRLTPEQYFQIDPVLVCGPAGVGKTAVLQAVAGCLGVPFKRFDLAALSMGSELFGLSFGWATGHPGEIFRLLAESAFMNPVIVLDEIEKAYGNHNAPVLPGLLTLLEHETSRSFRDEAMKVAFDASRITWFATANEPDLLSLPLRSRFVEVRIERPDGEDAVMVASSIYASIRKRAPWGRQFPDILDRPLALVLASHSPREMSRLLNQAFGEAARCGRTFLKREDFPPPRRQRRSIGFTT
jgi:ATP-dependent Lon protease